MVSGASLSARVLVRLPWGPTGVPERIAPERWTSSLEYGPMPRRREPVRLRALADGTALLAASDAGEHVLVQLSGGGVERRSLPARGPLLDAVIAPGDAAVLLERDGGLRRVGPDRTTAWEQTAGGTRLLSTPDGRLLLAGDGADPALREIDLDTGALGDPVVPSRPGGEPFLAGHRMAFTSYDSERDQRLWVLHDLESGHEDVVRATDAAWPFLGSPIGADATGRAYGVAALELGRVAGDGDVDWRLPLASAVVDQADRVTVAGPAPDGTLVAVSEDGVRRLTLPPQAAAGARLVARRPDGTLLLHNLDTGGLMVYGPDGSYQGDEPAPAEPLLAFEDLQTPDRDAVTPTGEVLGAIHSPQGLTVVAFAAP